MADYITENQRLKNYLCSFYLEKERTETKLAGVQNLGQQLQKKDEENKKLKEKVERLETMVARAENRVAQLTQQLQSCEGSPNPRAIVTPGVSKKILEALTRENTKLRLTLDHMTTKDSTGTELASENRELHDIIMKLKENLQAKNVEVKQLQEALGANENEYIATLNDQVVKLNIQVEKLQRGLNGKQVFCESLMSENESLKKVMEATKNERDERIVEVKQLKKELGEHMHQPGIKSIMDRVADDQDNVDGPGVQELQSKINELENILQNSHEERNNLVIARDQLQEMCQHLGEELGKKEKELEENNAKFSSQLEQKNSESLEELRKMSTELESMKQIHDLMQENLRLYEHDFTAEHEENMKLKRDLEQLNGENGRLIESFEHVKTEYFNYRQTAERLMAQHQQRQAKAPPVHSSLRRQTSGRDDCTSSVREPWQTALSQQSLMARGWGREVFADGGDHTDAPSRRQDPQAGQVQCPTCKKKFPHELLESHFRDCNGED